MQADHHRAPCSASDKPIMTGTPPQLIPMATVPPPRFLIGPSGGYTILPPIAPLSSMEGSSFSSLTSLHPFGSLNRPITAIPYYSPTDVYQRGGATSAAITANTGTSILATQTNGASAAQPPSAQNQDHPSPPPPPTLPHSHPHQQVGMTDRSSPPTPSRRHGSSDDVMPPQLHPSPHTSVPDSLNLVSVTNRSPTRNLSATTPDQTPQAATPGLRTEVIAQDGVPVEVKMEPASSEDPFPSCTRPKSADATMEEASFSSKNPYPINALIDVPTSLSRASRTSSLSSSISSFRFGGSLNKLWASQLSLSNKVNMKSTG